MKRCFLFLLGTLLILANSCKKDVEKSTEKQLLEFSVGALGGNAQGVVDETTKTVTLKAEAGTDVTKLVPIMKISEGASVSPASGVAQDFTNPVTYTVIAEDGSKQVYTVKVEVAKSSEKAILTFKLSNQIFEFEGAIDEANKKIAFVVPFGTSVKELVPSITISKGASVSPSVALKQDFTKPVTYTVTAEDGTKQDYEVSVVVAKSSEAKITSFKFVNLDAKVVIDHGVKAVKVEVPYGTDVTKLIPVVEISDKATISPVAEATDFSNAVTYKVTSESKEVSNTYTVTVEVKKFDTQIESVSSKSLAPDDILIIKGKFLPKKTKVEFSGNVFFELEIISESATELKVRVPKDARFGSYTLWVTSDNSLATENSLKVINPNLPAITKVEKTSLVRGLDELVIYGKNLNRPTEMTYVQIGSSVTNISVNADGTIARMKVPADTPLGKISVSLQVGGELTNELTVTILENTQPKPSVESVSATAIFGEKLVIKGKNFATSGNEVYLNRTKFFGFKAKIVSESSTEIVVLLPVNEMQDSYSLVINSNGQSIEYATPIAINYGALKLTGLVSTTVKSGEDILVKGSYVYNNQSIKYLTVLINGEKGQFTFSSKDLNTLVLDPASYYEPGVYTLKIKAEDSSVLLDDVKFTVVE